ncbi:MAG: hypothetical protein JWL81_1287 [Verrucomicrobiales bacterium]|nr:hypothetical protein [Verrucomicrobiales bacterium]
MRIKVFQHFLTPWASGFDIQLGGDCFHPSSSGKAACPASQFPGAPARCAKSCSTRGKTRCRCSNIPAICFPIKKRAGRLNGSNGNAQCTKSITRVVSPSLSNTWRCLQNPKGPDCCASTKDRPGSTWTISVTQFSLMPGKILTRCDRICPAYTGPSTSPTSNAASGGVSSAKFSGLEKNSQTNGNGNITVWDAVKRCSCMLHQKPRHVAAPPQSTGTRCWIEPCE